MLAYYSWNEEWLRHTLEGKQSLCLPRTLVLEESAIWILQGHSLWQTNSRFFPFLLSMAKNENHMKRKRKTEHLVSTPFLPYSNKLFCDYCCHSPQSVHQWFSHLHESESPGGLIECAGPLPAFLMQLVHQGGGGESAFWSSSLVKLTRLLQEHALRTAIPEKVKHSVPIAEVRKLSLKMPRSSQGATAVTGFKRRSFLTPEPLLSLLYLSKRFSTWELPHSMSVHFILESLFLKGKVKVLQVVFSFPKGAEDGF